MAFCIKCGDDFSEAREALGFQTCLDCGERDAQVESNRKAKCIAPAFNKGPYMYISSTSQAKDVGK